MVPKVAKVREFKNILNDNKWFQLNISFKENSAHW